LVYKLKNYLQRNQYLKRNNIAHYVGFSQNNRRSKFFPQETTLLIHDTRCMLLGTSVKSRDFHKSALQAII
jgi:hypothetical protein